MKLTSKIVMFMLPILLLAEGVSGQTITITRGAATNEIAKITVDGDGSGNTTLDCDGTLDIRGSLVLIDDARIHCGGDFIKNGTPSTFSEGNGKVVMDGTTAQVISGGTIPNSTSYSFYDLTIDNPSGVTLVTTNLTQVTIIRVLEPKNGTLTTNNILRFNDRSTSPRFARLAYGVGNVTGNVRVEKRLAFNNENWRQISIPVTYSTPLPASNWNSFATNINALLSGHTPSNQINTYVWDASPANIAFPTDYAIGWREASINDNQFKPYSIYLNSPNGLHTFGSGTPNNQEFFVSGTLNQGDFNNNLFFTIDPDANPVVANSDGWNMIANPWAALLDITALITDATNFTSSYKAIHVLDANTPLDGGATYRAILGSGVTKINWGTTGDSLSATALHLEPFQAFWVKAFSVGQVCNLIASSMQKATGTTQQLMKKNPQTIRLNVFDTDSLWDQLVVYFDENLTREFDLSGDAYFLRAQNKDVPLFYAKEGERAASIIGRSADITDSVQVVFGSTKEQSKFYIHADLDELEEGWFVYLRDKKDNKTFSLQHNKSIAFSHGYGLESERFVVYYSKNEQAFEYMLTGEESNILFFVNNGTLHLQSVGLAGNAQINLYDAVGRIVHSEKKQLALGERIEVDFSTTQQFIVVEVVLNGNAYREKVYF